MRAEVPQRHAGDDDEKRVGIRVGYHRRSLEETTMFRFKQITGPSTKARSFEGQRAEILTRCKILNVMTLAAASLSYRLP